MRCNVRKYKNRLQKTQHFSYYLNIKISLESVYLFLHVFSCLKFTLTMEHYIKLLIIVIWRFAIFCSCDILFWGWQLAPWNLGQLAPASFFFTYKRLTAIMFESLLVKRHPSREYNSLLRWKRRLMSIT